MCVLTLLYSLWYSALYRKSLICEVHMARLNIREVAGSQNMTLTLLHAAVNRRLPVDKPVAMGTMRRYWYATKDGKEYGEPIEQVDIHLLGTIARALGVSINELLNEEELGQHVPELMAA
jgi:methyl coenzyme M reductase subunit D